MESTDAFDDAEHAPSHQTSNDEAILSPLSLENIEDRLRSEQQRLINEMEQRLLHELTKSTNTNSTTTNSSVIQAIKINGSGDYLTRYIEGDEDGEQTTYFSMPGDIFSMLCISDLISRPFMYAMVILLTKLFFYTVILWDILSKAVFFPKEIPDLVKATQFVMLPITVIVTDEGVLAALFIYRHMIYDEQVLEQHHLVTKKRYMGFNLLRFVDAILYQIVIFFVLMQAEKVLDVFLNFAALRFLMEIDKVAFTVAANGYLSEEVQLITKQIQTIKLRGNESDFRYKTAQVFFSVSLVAMISAWAVVQYGF